MSLARKSCANFNLEETLECKPVREQQVFAVGLGNFVVTKRGGKAHPS